ncbi:MAG: hypothetical protein GY821_17455 [Gammaproteobacteria bacterium]|nr:hypothetical protein [Gammaproteobacteria bacterium]
MRVRRVAAAICGVFMLVVTTAVMAVPIDRHPPVVIGIVVPVQIEAMKEIVAGFTSTLRQKYPGKVTFLVQNAQGDINLQRTIIQQLKQRHVNVIVPIGTTVTEMTINMVKHTPIVALAAVYSDKERLAQRPRNTTNVSDEIIPAKQFAFMQQALPKIHKITLVHSSDPHAFSDAKEAEKAAKQYGLTIQNLMVQQLPDLYTIGKRVDKDSQAIFVLKDEMIVSGIRTLAHDAAQRHIPLIASDDGSVQKGAALAIGVEESQIGIDGAKLTLQVLNGKPVSQIPVKMMDHYKLFINAQAAKRQGVNVVALKKAATSAGYPVVMMKGIGA